MSTIIAFKAVDNSAIRTYWESRQQAHDQWWERVKAFGAKIGHPKLSIRSGVFGSHVLGYEPEEGEGPDAGWRIHKDYGICVPSLRSKAGKALEAELQDLTWRPTATPGVNGYLHASSGRNDFSTYILSPAIRQGHSGDWYLSFSKVPFDEDLKKVDSAVWVPVKLSEFYAQTEDT